MDNLNYEKQNSQQKEPEETVLRVVSQHEGIDIEYYKVSWEVDFDDRVQEGERLGVARIRYINGIEENIVLISPSYGTIITLADEDIELNDPEAAIIENCQHEELLKDLCTFCGKLYSKNDRKTYASYSDKLKVNDKLASKYHTEYKETLQTTKKLILILDLDNTLVHAVKVSMKAQLPPDTDKTDIYEFNFSGISRFFVKLRPYFREFIDGLTELYDIYIYTMGTRIYAEEVCKILDPHQTLGFRGNKIVSFEDNLEIGNVKMLTRIVPEDEHMQVILDDRQDVWQGSRNLLFTKPFKYFKEKPPTDLESSNNNNNKQDSTNTTTTSPPQEDIIDIRRKSDCYLYFAGHMLKRIHKIFFELINQKGEADVRDIIDELKTNIFNNINVTFSGVHPKNIQENNTLEWKTVEKLGGKCTLNYEDNYTQYVLAKENRKTLKVKRALELNTPILHYNWIYYSQMFFTKLNTSTFDLLKLNKNQVENKDFIEGNLANDNKDTIIQENLMLIDVTLKKLLKNLNKKSHFSLDDLDEFRDTKKIKTNTPKTYEPLNSFKPPAKKFLNHN